LELYVSGTLRRQVFLPYLSFLRSQSSLLTSLVFMKKGDELLIKYNVMVLDQTNGLMPYPGQVTLVGGPTVEHYRSFLYVEYLSTDMASLNCSSCDVTCSPCQPCKPNAVCVACFKPCPDCNNSCEPCSPT